MKQYLQHEYLSATPPTTITWPCSDPLSIQAASAPRLLTIVLGFACVHAESCRLSVWVKESEEHDDVIPPMTSSDSPS